MRARGRKAFRPNLVPGTATLTLTTYAPIVTASNPQTVTPGTAELTLTTYAPTVTGPAPVLVTPGTAALTLTAFAPVVTASQNVLVTPATRPLTLTTYAPVVNGAVVETPGTAALTLTTFPPTVTATAHKVVVPTTASLALTTYAPTVTSANHLVVVPATASLTTTRFAPTVTATQNRRVVPATKALTTTRYAPVITVAGGGAIFYISPTGSDTTGTGSSANPWRTIAKFVAQSSAGETLHCRGGTYTSQPEISTTGHSGTSGSPITVRNHPGETPVFVSPAFYIEGGSSYWVLDGLTINGAISGSSSHVWIGNGRSLPGSTDTHHITIRNCTITKGGGAVTAHAIYVSHQCDFVTVEDNIITGVGPSLPEDRCAGVHIYHDPMPTVVLIQRNFIRNWPKGIITFSDIQATVTTGSILHNTFQNNDYHIDLRHHGAFLVRDNVGGTRINGDLYDPIFSANTTADHNYWGQTLTSTGRLTAGSPAINGALDGSDAGAYDYP